MTILYKYNAILFIYNKDTTIDGTKSKGDMINMKKLKLGLVGCGGMMKAHIQGVLTLDNVEVTALCDIEIDRAKDVAELFDNPYVTDNYKTMVDYIDAILIALPHDLHFECGVFFARNKKHVLMEKPLCNTEAECLRLIDVCEEEGVTLMCAYPVPYYPAIVKLKELLDSGEYGKVMQMSIWTEQLTRYDELHWLSTSRMGGGQFFSHGCHYVDLLLRFLGDPIEGTHFGTTVGTPWLMQEGTSIASFKFANGALGYHGATWGAKGTEHGSLDIHVFTEKGMLRYKEGELTFYHGLDDHKPDEPAICKKEVIFEKTDLVKKNTNAEIAHFADCVFNNKTPMTDARSSLQSLRIIWKMYAAEKEGKIADLRGMGLSAVKK